MKITHNCEVVLATPEHAEELAETMRKEDADEVWHLNRHTPKEALDVCLETSEEAWTALVDGKVLCMFGVARLTLVGPNVSPWMLGSNEMYRNWRLFARKSKEVVAAWRARYPKMVNVVDARYVTAVRWLEWLGFMIHPVFLAHGTEPAHVFEMDDKDV